MRALLVENITDPPLIGCVAREGGASVGGSLYSHALSPPGTYLKLFAHNVATLAAGLQGRKVARRAAPDTRSIT